MNYRRVGARGLVVMVCLGALFGLQTAGASATDWSRFDYCPSTNPEVLRCTQSVTSGGEVVLGKKKVPIVNPVTLQGGYGAPSGEFVSKFYAATNGATLSKTAQPVPGGLLGIVPPEGSPWLVKKLSAFFFENGLTGVNSTLELARPASEIQISEINLLFEMGVALKLPVKAKLDNPFLGKNCYVGSSSSPIWISLTSGTTAPPGPNTPISGSAGSAEFLEEAEILKLSNVKLVDNAWSAPKASGCGGVLSFLVDPIINSQLGLASPAGKNTAILENTVYTATAESVNAH